MANQQGASKEKQRSSPSAAPAHSQQEFLFVDAAKAKTSRQGRRNARSFVMQKARRDRPWSTSKHAAKQRKSPESTSPTTVGTPDLSNTPITSTPSPPIAHTGAQYFPFVPRDNFLVTKPDLCSDCQIFYCQPGQTLCPKCLLFRTSILTEDLDNSLFDPFGTGPVDMTGRVSGLIRHFVTEMAPHAIAVDVHNKYDLMRSHWFGTALSDRGFMHSLLGTVALHQWFSGGGSVETIFYHRMKAITAVKAAILDPDAKVGISDANIGAVFNLLTIEEVIASPSFDKHRPSDETPYQRSMHLNGLRNMIQLRGGLMAMNSNRILQAFILWHSTAHAIASFDPPYLSTSDLIDTACIPRYPSGYRPGISQHLLDCCKSAQVKESLTALVESSLILIADLNTLFSETDSTIDPLDVKNYACVLECMLLEWLRENEHVVTPLEDALCVTLLIFAVRITEALNQRSDMLSLHRAASKRLEKALSATSRTEWQSCPDLLLWILAVGAISAEDSDESPWFAHQVSLACSEFGIQSANALLVRLHLCGWVSSKLDQAVGQLWERSLRLEPNLDESYTSGPLQVQVASPDFTDWQNIDWSALSPLMSNLSIPPGGFSGATIGGDETFYDFSADYTFPNNNPFYMQ
ncbi:hypothetical protein K458DRAFT_54724 [Lentithecium fluviatile CBS 122367]|uniref:Transcription factor domain-containing protein n=1 Tax=Lentithecium fluviatile CBS 122367 TaxID=1168545 RepID=A0A6G1IWX7_9PLEO|nr:hypothetical protein K458DRAFT_54724 [Lentithecium fluviatile CBS 122367]